MFSSHVPRLQRVMHAVLSGRVLLHLREVAVNRVQAGSMFDTLNRSGAVSEPNFLKPTLASALQTSTWFGDNDDDHYQSSSQTRSTGPHSTTTVAEDEYNGGWNKP